MNTKYVVKAKKSWSQYERDVVKAATEWAINELMLEGRGKVVVKMCGEIGAYGQATFLYDDVFMVHIAKHKSVKELIQTVFHELTHVKQFVFDGFDLYSNGASWRGKTMKVSNTHWGYWKSPWEREARKNEKKLWKKYSKA